MKHCYIWRKCGCLCVCGWGEEESISFLFLRIFSCSTATQKRMRWQFKGVEKMTSLQGISNLSQISSNENLGWFSLQLSHKPILPILSLITTAWNQYPHAGIFPHVSQSLLNIRGSFTFPLNLTFHLPRAPSYRSDKWASVPTLHPINGSLTVMSSLNSSHT